MACPPPSPTSAETGDAGTVVVRYWAAARSAAGVDSDEVAVSGAVTLARVLDEIRARHADRPAFARTLAVCSILVGDRPVGGHDPAGVSLRAGDTVELLPPFAGGCF